MSVSVVAYGLGNLGSVMNMLHRIEAEPRTVTTPEEVANSDRLLLPGVGAFDTGMRLLREAHLIDAIQAFAESGRAVLGVCLGMQMLLSSSEEGTEAGLGLIEGASRRFDDSPGVRVPHVGWNTIAARKPDPLLASLPADSRFYFVHSYHVVPTAVDDILAVTRYGSDFVSMIRRDNVMGAQFHPEKSHAFGMQILRNFAEL